jgi:cytochrome c
LTVTYLLGHDQHSHEISDTTGCTGQFETTTPGHGGATNLFAVFGASYEDPGVGGQGSLTGTAEVILRPGN